LCSTAILKEFSPYSIAKAPNYSGLFLFSGHHLFRR